MIRVAALPSLLAWAGLPWNPALLLGRLRCYFVGIRPRASVHACETKPVDEIPL